MTGTQDQQQRTDEYAQQLLAIEQAAVRAVTTRLICTLAALRRQGAGRMMLAQTAAARDHAVTTLSRELEAQAVPLLDGDAWKLAIEAEAQRAIDLAAVFTLGPANRFVPVLASEPEVERAVRSAQAAAADRITRAVKLLRRAETLEHVQGALRVAQGAVAAAATGAEYAVNSAANSAPLRIAIKTGQKLVWVAERDACLVCLALSGQIADPATGEWFDEDATFGDSRAPEVWPPGMPLTAPPRHPHCRCILQVWAGTANPAVADWPSRLRHEALRSVARGFSLPSESGAARVRAAERILRNGQVAALPKSVRAYAASAVQAGRFPTRAVPAPARRHHQPRRAA